MRNRVTSVTSGLIGLAMLGTWLALLLSGRVPELATDPVQTVVHISIELLTALALLAGAVGLARRRPWGVPVHLLSLGMLLYAVVAAGGYYAQRGVWPAVAVFAVLLIITLALIIRGIRTS